MKMSCYKRLQAKRTPLTFVQKTAASGTLKKLTLGTNSLNFVTQANRWRYTKFGKQFIVQFSHHHMSSNLTNLCAMCQTPFAMKGYRFGAEIVPRSHVKMLVKLTIFLFTFFQRLDGAWTQWSTCTSGTWHSLTSLSPYSASLSSSRRPYFTDGTCHPSSASSVLLCRWEGELMTSYKCFCCGKIIFIDFLCFQERGKKLCAFCCSLKHAFIDKFLSSFLCKLNWVQNRDQFHQHSTRSFCAKTLAPIKYKPKM